MDADKTLTCGKCGHQEYHQFLDVRMKRMAKHKCKEKK